MNIEKNIRLFIRMDYILSKKRKKNRQNTNKKKNGGKKTNRRKPKASESKRITDKIILKNRVSQDTVE